MALSPDPVVNGLVIEMTRIARAGLALLALSSLAGPARASAQGAPVSAAEEAPAGASVPEEPAWSGRVSGSWYFVPDEADFPILIGAADRGALHLEARYGYEDLRTVSAWAGWTFEFTGALDVAVVPMLGAVLGRTNGMAPGLELTIGRGPVEYYLETEVVIDFGSSASSYFYAWSELSVAPVEWLKLGGVIQRTRVVQTTREITPGVFAGVSVTPTATLTGYWFAPGRSGQYAALSLSLEL